MGLMSKVIRGVAQEPLPRYVPKHGVSERLEDLLNNKKVIKALSARMDDGIKIGAQDWYETGALRDRFIDYLGDELGPQRFAMYMDRVAASSPRSDVASNVRNASYYYTENLAGRTANVGDPHPSPYGHFAKRTHQGNVKHLQENGAWDPIQNPKPASFSQNLQGNLLPVTVDAHAMRLPAILSRDPRWLETSFKQDVKDASGRVIKDAKGNAVTETINPRKMHASGELSMDDAVNRPAFWDGDPNDNEYAAFEGLYTDLANKKGLHPAQGQAAAWVGGGKITGLGSKPVPFMDFVNERAVLTAKKRGITPDEALRDFITGKAPLLGVPMAMAGPVAEALRDQERPRGLMSRAA